jgi:hypothetical protein
VLSRIRFQRCVTQPRAAGRDRLDWAAHQTLYLCSRRFGIGVQPNGPHNASAAQSSHPIAPPAQFAVDSTNILVIS